MPLLTGLARVRARIMIPGEFLSDEVEKPFALKDMWNMPDSHHRFPNSLRIKNKVGSCHDLGCLGYL